jgi:beta-glucosidase
VGYRWYDAKHLKPLFPFGYGLSYTSFHLIKLNVTPSRIEAGHQVKVRLDVTNTGKRAGAEVVQLYIGDPASAKEPPKQLKGFKKVTLAPGQTKPVTMTLDRRAFSIWDTKAHAWVIREGNYRIMVGDSSRHLPLKSSVRITDTSNP